MQVIDVDSHVSVTKGLDGTPFQVNLLADGSLWGVVVHVEFRDNKLLLVVPPDRFMLLTPPATLIPTGAKGEFTVQEGRAAGEPLRFQFGPDGTVTGFVLGEGGNDYTRRS